MAGERQARLADRIRVILAERLEKGLRDPRLGFVTITDVRVSGDPALAARLADALRVRAGEDDATLTHPFHAYPARLHPRTARALVEARSKSLPATDPVGAFSRYGHLRVTRPR